MWLCGQHLTNLKGFWYYVHLYILFYIHVSFFLVPVSSNCIVHKASQKIEYAMQLGDQRWERNKMDIAKPRLSVSCMILLKALEDDIGWLCIISLENCVYCDFDVELFWHCSSCSDAEAVNTATLRGRLPCWRVPSLDASMPRRLQTSWQYHSGSKCKKCIKMSQEYRQNGWFGF